MSEKQDNDTKTDESVGNLNRFLGHIIGALVGLVAAILVETGTVFDQIEFLSVTGKLSRSGRQGSA